jgi:hypothetical protein
VSGRWLQQRERGKRRGLSARTYRADVGELLAADVVGVHQERAIMRGEELAHAAVVLLVLVFAAERRGERGERQRGEIAAARAQALKTALPRADRATDQLLGRTSSFFSSLLAEGILAFLFTDGGGGQEKKKGGGVRVRLRTKLGVCQQGALLGFSLRPKE